MRVVLSPLLLTFKERGGRKEDLLLARLFSFCSSKTGIPSFFLIVFFSALSPAFAILHAEHRERARSGGQKRDREREKIECKKKSTMNSALGEEKGPDHVE